MVNKEFIVQYDEEGKNGYPQQPFMKNLNLVNYYIYTLDTCDG